MSLSSTYRQTNYMGEWPGTDATDGALKYIRGNKWDTNSNGTGNPREGMVFIDTDDHKYKSYMYNAAVNALDWREIHADFSVTLADIGVPASGDEVLLYDTSATGYAKATVANLKDATSYWGRSSTTLSPKTAGDTIDVNAVGSAISLDSNTGSNFTVTGTDQSLTIAAVGGGSAQGLDLNSAGTSVSAIDINATAGGIDIDAALGITFDSTGASSFIVTGSNLQLTIAAVGGGANQKLNLNSVGTGVGAIDINATAGGVDIDAALGITLDSTGASNFIVAGSNLQLTIAAVGGGANQKLNLNSVGTGSGAVDINATAGGVDIDAAEGIALNSASGVCNFTCAGSGSVLSLEATGGGAGQKVVINSAGTGVSAVDINAAAGGLDIDVATGFEVDAGSGISLDAAAASNFTVTGSGIDFTIAVAGGGVQSLILNSAGTGAKAVDINATAGGIALDAAGAISLDGGLVSNFTVDGASLTLSTTTSGSMYVSSAETLTVTSGGNTSVTSQLDILLNYNDAAGLGKLYIYNDGVVVGAFTGAGLVAFSPISGQDFRVDTAGVGAISLDSAAASNFTVLGANLTVSTTTSGNVLITAADDLTCRADEDYSVYQDGVADANRRFQATAAGGINITPLAGQDLNAYTTTSGDIFLTSAGDAYVNAQNNLVLDYDESAVGYQLAIRYQGGTIIGSFTGSGSIAFAPVDDEPFDVETAGDSWSCIDGVYFVNGDNTSAFEALLKYFQTYTIHGEIVLGNGTHYITWTTAQTLGSSMVIRGAGAAVTTVQLVGTDADTCLNFTGTVNISGISFERSAQMTNQTYGIQLGAAGSSIRDCYVRLDSQGGAAATAISVVVAATDCLIDNVKFDTVYAKVNHITSAAPRTIVKNCKAIPTVSACDSTGAISFSSTANYSVVESCYIQSKNSGATATPTIAIAADYCSINNTTVIAGETASTGHGVRCLTISGDYAHISNSSFVVLWPAATNCTDYLGDFSGLSVFVDNCFFHQTGFGYTNTSSTGTAGVLKFSNQKACISNCQILATDCKGGIWITATGDYASISNSIISGTKAYAAGYHVSSIIWVTSGAHYGTITGNIFVPRGESGGFAIRSTAINGCSGWTITSNVGALNNGAYGIYVNYWTGCNISGNTASSGENFVSGTNTANFYGYGWTTAGTGNNM